MKLRCALSAVELTEVYDHLQERLDRLGIETQPEVGIRILQLVKNPDAGMQEFSKVVRADVALTGKILRISNSAYFAQRNPVTSVDRACVLLGYERLRALSLGFYLSHAAASDTSQQISRAVWGQSVFRACLAAELARTLIPARTAEAFAIGLMLDAGVPLMYKLLGQSFLEIYRAEPGPTRMFRREFQTLPYTHVDVVTAMCKRWNLPELLTHPLSWHHNPPPETAREDAAIMLHRIAYYVGAISLDQEQVATREAAPLPSMAARLFKMPTDELATAVHKAGMEYEAVSSLFSKIAQGIPDVSAIAACVHRQLIDLVDQSVARTLAPGESTERQVEMRLSGRVVEFESAGDGNAVVYLRDERGERIISHRFQPGTETPESLREALAIDNATDEDMHTLSTLLSSLAA